MATQYSPILKLALPVQGELSGTWGDVVNDNITSMVEEAIAGRAVINSWTTNSHTLTSANGTTAESRCAMLEFTDTGTALTGAGTVICPTQTKIYIAKNASGQIITVKTSAGTGVAVQDGETKFVFCDGTNVVEAVTSMTTLKVGTGTQVNTILDEDNMASDSDTALATQQSIKAYVDSQVTAQDLDFAGDSGTGAVDLDSQSLTVAGTANEIETSASGQTLTVGLPSAIIVTTSVTTPTVQVTNLNANDGTVAATIADSTGVVTVASAVLTTADINGGTADNVVIGGTTAAAGSFTTVGATGNITSQGQVITDTINEQTATSGVTVDGVLLKDGGVTLATGVAANAILDEDNMASDSPTALATQQSIKAYVDSQVTAQDLDFAGDTGTGAVDLDSQSFTVAGTANEIETSASGQTITIGLPNAVTITSLTATTADINGGTIDGTTIGGTTPAAVTTSALVATTADINAGTIDGTTIGGTSAAAGTFTTLNATGGGALTGTWSDLGSVTTVDINGGTIDGTIIGGTTAAAATITTLVVSTSTTMELDQITSTSDLPISLGGTGASTAAAARTNLDVDQAGTALALAIALG
jgi:hypothetical protein